MAKYYFSYWYKERLDNHPPADGFGGTIIELKHPPITADCIIAIEKEIIARQSPLMEIFRVEIISWQEMA